MLEIKCGLAGGSDIEEPPINNDNLTLENENLKKELREQQEIMNNLRLEIDSLKNELKKQQEITDNIKQPKKQQKIIDNLREHLKIGNSLKKELASSLRDETIDKKPLINDALIQLEALSEIFGDIKNPIKNKNVKIICTYVKTPEWILNKRCTLNIKILTIDVIDIQLRILFIEIKLTIT